METRSVRKSGGRPLLGSTFGLADPPRIPVKSRKREVPVPPPAAPIARGAGSPAPAEQGAFAPNYRMGQDAEAQPPIDIAVEVELEPFGFPGLQACFANLGIPYAPSDDKGWQERLERIIFRPIGRVGPVREVGCWLFRQVYSIKTVELVVYSYPRTKSETMKLDLPWGVC
ncbi:hypothetical protein TWF132_006462 [Orbilia oligospora]|nr:hypothetical protein TWF132_006462 [Orbilia oligospora]